MTNQKHPLPVVPLALDSALAPDSRPIPDLEGVIEIKDEQIDLAAIMAEIRSRIQTRRASQGYEGRKFPTYGAVLYEGTPKDIPYDADLHYYLRILNDRYADVDTAAILASSPATRLPIVGKLWGMIRSSVHDLVLFYVRRAVGQQTEINHNLVGVLNRSVAVMENQQRAIEQLQRELDLLKSAGESGK